MSLAVVLTLASLVVMPSETSRPDKNEFVQLFAATCMANIFSPEKLRETLNSPLTPEIPPERAQAFLLGRPGTAWEVFFGTGQYAISLLESGFCAVYTRKADVAEVQAGFLHFVATAPESMLSRELDPAQAGPNTDDLTTKAYAWSRPAERLEIVFTLTTSNAAQDPEIQAMASVSLSQSEP